MSFFKKKLFQAYLATLKSDHTKYIRAMRDPEQAQDIYLQQLLRANQDTVFGEKYGFRHIHSKEDYRRQVPLHSYEDLRHDMDQVFQGNEKQLVGSSVRIFEKTSGTTSKNKVIPFTENFLKEISLMTSAWIYQSFAEVPEMKGKRLYYSASPQMRQREFSPMNVPVGMEDDSEYLGILGKIFVGMFMAVPAEVSKVQDPEVWKKQTLLHLVECKDLGFISLWSPTLLQVWIRFLETADQNFVSQLSREAQKRLQKSRQGIFSLKTLWPNLGMISFWTDGPSAMFCQDLLPHLQGIVMQSKGLMATEGIVSIPMGCAKGSPLAVHCQFLEFIDLETQKLTWAHELIVGKKYSPIISNSAGLYRYHLKDVVECTGMYHQTPLIQFVSKLECVSDMCGEKLSTEQVLCALTETMQELHLHLKWAQVVASSQQNVGYTLLTEAVGQDLSAFEKAFDQKLRKNIHYDYARKLGQLAPVKSCSFGLSYLQDQYQNFMISENVKLGDIKFLPLMPHDRFLAFLGKPVEKRRSDSLSP